MPLTEAQATRINALGGAKAGEALLTPRQRALFELSRKHPKAGWPDVLGVDFARATAQVEAVARGLEKR